MASSFLTDKCVRTVTAFPTLVEKLQVFDSRRWCLIILLASRHASHSALRGGNCRMNVRCRVDVLSATALCLPLVVKGESCMYPAFHVCFLNEKVLEKKNKKYFI